MHIEIINFERDAVDIAWIDPSRIKTDGNAISSPATPCADFCCTTVSANTHELVRVRKDALTRSEDDDGVIAWNILEWLVSIALTPLVMWHRLERTLEISGYVICIEWVIHAAIFAHFLLVKIITKRKVETCLADMVWLVWHADNRPISDCFFYLGVTIDTH